MKNFYALLFILCTAIVAHGSIVPSNNISSVQIESGDLFDGFLSENDLSIFPNPVKNFATIEFAEGVDKIVIMNIVGKEVASFTTETEKYIMKVNLTDLQPGVYFIAAYSSGVKLITKRFIKEQ